MFPFKISSIVMAGVLLGLAVIFLKFAVTTAVALNFSYLSLGIGATCFASSCCIIERAIDALIFD